MMETARTVDEVGGKVAIVGAKVVAEDLDPAANELARDGIAPLVADVAADDSAERAVALAEERF